MPYRFPRTIRVDLSEFGDGLFAEIQHPKLMHWDVLEGLFNGVGSEVSAEAAAQLVTGLVVSWNLTDTLTDEALPIPKEDPAVLERVPGFAVVEIARVAGNLAAEYSVPKS